MKKCIVLLIVILSCVSFSFAQALKINQMQWDEDYTAREFVREIEPGDVIEIDTDKNFVQLDSDVINISNSAQSVNLKMEVSNPTEGIDISACWGACLEPWNFNFDPVEIAEEGEEQFIVDYYTNDILNTAAWITCTFSVEGYEDFVFYIKFGDAVSVTEPIITTNKAYPNPATSVVNIDYAVNKGNAQIVLYNILGVQVYEQTLNGQEGIIKINISDFTSGIYFYTIKIDGKAIETKKFVISR
ncbi:MAG: T9SS type A sorting domain-containing protein [Bacteroidales bacterium]|nr:T9SS type A sorting domain-containing protein [Bacteroidales bacterium]